MAIVQQEVLDFAQGDRNSGTWDPPVTLTESFPGEVISS